MIWKLYRGLTIKTKIRLALFFVSFMPFVIILIYLYNTGKKRMIDESIKQYKVQVKQVATSVNQEMEGLKKELRFLASLDVMNDLLVNDVDKRIAGLLQNKCRDLGAGISIYAIDENNKNVADTNIKPISQDGWEKIVHRFQQAKTLYKDHFFMGHYIYIFVPVFAKMYDSTRTGYILLSYDLTRLLRFVPQPSEGMFLFYFPKQAVRVGMIPKTIEHVLATMQKNPYVKEGYLVVNESLGGIFSEGFILETVPKLYAMAFIDRFIILVWVTFIIGTLIILILSWWIGERIIKPIEILSETTKRIIETGDYSTHVSLNSEGEVQVLSRQFNSLISTVNSSMTALQKESSLRLARLIHLITIFNELIQTQTHEACIEVVTSKLDIFIEDSKFVFSKEEVVDETNEIPLYFTDYMDNTRYYYGKIIRIGNGVCMSKSNEREFFRAVASMVMLQLDRIELLRQIRTVSAAKSAFISYMSHELRTPLHAILGTTQYLIGYEHLTPQQQEKVGRIEASAGHLLSMINAMLDLAQIEAGKVEVTPEICDSLEIDQIIAEAVEITGVLAEQKALILTKETPPLCSGIYADKKYVKQIVLNLLSNAIKYTQKGSISLSYRCEKAALYVIVTDTGTGLSKEDLATVFNVYKQLRNRHQEMGNGLGLAISRKLAQLFDADVRLESEGRGKGVRATIILRRQ